MNDRDLRVLTVYDMSWELKEAGLECYLWCRTIQKCADAEEMEPQLVTDDALSCPYNMAVLAYYNNRNQG